MKEKRPNVAKFEIVPLGELKTRLPAKLVPLVEEYREKLEKLSANQGARLTLEKGDDPKDLRKALKAAAGSLNRRVRFPFRGGEGPLSFHLVRTRGWKAEAEAPKRRRGRPRKSATLMLTFARGCASADGSLERGRERGGAGAASRACPAPQRPGPRGPDGRRLDGGWRACARRVLGSAHPGATRRMRATRPLLDAAVGRRA